MTEPPPAPRNTGASAAPKRKYTTRKKRSRAWDHFKEHTDINGNKIGKCNYCGKEYAAKGKTNGTTNMLNHVDVCPENPHRVDTKQARLSLQPNREIGDKAVSLVAWKFSQDATRKALAKMIITDELPFKFVEGEGFKQFMQVACPNFRIPSRWTVARDCLELYDSEFELLKRMFKNSSQRVCLTTDTWTSIQRINYMCLTAHFIDDDWNLQKRIINFCPIVSHKGEAISLAIEKCLRRWEIEKKVFTITVDNASSNDTAMGLFKKKMSKWDSSILKGDLVHVRCTAHILNLVVNDGLKGMSESIGKIRDAIRYIRQSPARLNKFKECAKIEKIESKKSLCLDVQTRWNSCYMMLSIAEKFERAFERYDEQDPCFKMDMQVTKLVDKLDENGKVIYGPDGKPIKEYKIVDRRPTSEDWANCRKFATLLEYFYDLTLKISGTLYITSNSVMRDIYEINELLEEWKVSHDLDLCNLGTRMKEKFDKYWGNMEKSNPLLYVSLVLDPRYKLDFTLYLLKKMYGEDKGESAGRRLTNTLRSLYSDYKSKKEPQAEGSKSQDMSSSDIDSISEPNMQKEKRQKLLMAEFQKQKAQNGCFGDISSSELDKYLREETEQDGSDFKILVWWKQNAPRYPILSSIARDVLAIPVSTVASESAFSTGGRILDSFRSSLTPKVVEGIICTQNWLRSPRKTIDIDNDLEELEKLEEEISKLGLDPSQALPTPMEI